VNRIYPPEPELPPTRAIKAGGFLIDPSRLEVLGPDGARIDLKPRSFRVLHHLAANAGHAVPKDEILAVCWPDVIVTEDSLTQAVSEIRRALGEGGRDLIRTVPRVGYLLAADPAATPQPAPESISAAPAGETATARQAGRHRLSLSVFGLFVLAAAALWLLFWRTEGGPRQIE
jgi:DNA-binding winged helix-turn-helix (wHTH) protein